MAFRLPVRLKKDPILECVCELRFSAHNPMSNASDLLPGIFYNELTKSGSAVELVTLPAGKLPQEIRQSNPELAFQPTHHLRVQNTQIVIGERLCAFSQLRPYPGWRELRKHILRMFDILLETRLVSNVDRLSLKYVNLLDAPEENDELSLVKANLSIAGLELRNPGRVLRAETVKDDAIFIITLATGASGSFPVGGEINTATGLMVEIDGVLALSPGSFQASKEQLIDRLHHAEKQVFFDILTDATLAQYQPMWAD